MHPVTAGYLFAGLVITAIAFSFGWLMLPLLILPLLWHGLRAVLSRSQPARGHEAFLLRSYALATVFLCLLYVVPGLWALRTLDPQSELAAVLGTRDLETIVHWFQLWFSDQLRAPGSGLVAVATAGVFWLLMHSLLSAAIGIYLMVRVLRRFLRWSERQPA